MTHPYDSGPLDQIATWQHQHQPPTVSPSVADFFAQPTEPDDVEEPIPADPLERVAAALEQLTAVMAAHTQLGTLVTLNAAERGRGSDSKTAAPATPVDDTHREMAMNAIEQLADLEAKAEVMSQAIADVDAALGKSKAAPALAAKAVIEAWRKGPAEPVEEKAEEPDTYADGTIAAVANNLPGGGQVGHTRTPFDQGPDYCTECSAERQEWVAWPCSASVAAIGDEAVNANFVPATVQEFRDEHSSTGLSDEEKAEIESHLEPEGWTPPETLDAEQVLRLAAGETGAAVAPTPEQPAHDASVTDWRSYARRVHGVPAGEASVFDTMNRSQVRTALGIGQPVEQTPVDGSSNT